MNINIFLAAPVSTLILIITVVTSIRAFRSDMMKGKMIFNPYLVVHHNEWHRIFTSGFIHGGWIHLIFNMYVFYNFAFPLEIIHLDHLGFFALYAAGLAISHLPRLILSKDDQFYNSLGASGAVSAVVLSMIMLDPIGFSIFGLAGWIFGLIYIGLSFILSIVGRDNIGHDAHLWGALAGIILTLIMRPESADTMMRVMGLG